MTKELNETRPEVSRTSAGLRDALFDELDDLRGGRTNATKANATAKLAGSIISTVEMELEVHKTMSRMKEHPETKALPPIILSAQ